MLIFCFVLFFNNFLAIIERHSVNSGIYTAVVINCFATSNRIIVQVKYLLLLMHTNYFFLGHAALHRCRSWNSWPLVFKWQLGCPPSLFQLTPQNQTTCQRLHLGYKQNQNVTPLTRMSCSLKRRIEKIFEKFWIFEIAIMLMNKWGLIVQMSS